MGFSAYSDADHNFLFLGWSTGLVGLSLSYALSLTGTQIFLTRWYCYLSNYLISVERIKQFMHIPQEPPAIVEDKRPPSSWPSKGRIELQDLTVRKLLEFLYQSFFEFFTLLPYHQSPQVVIDEFDMHQLLFLWVGCR